jgi:hypothetical protein
MKRGAMGVMAAHSRPRDGVLSHAYVAGIHVLRPCNNKDVDGRDEPGHDERRLYVRP